MRPSGKLKRFMSNADYQVDDEQTRIPRNFDDPGISSTLVGVPPLGGFSHLLNGRVKRGTPNLAKACFDAESDVAPAPFKLLPDYTEERSIRQRC
jgi:hypothetical protein